GHLWLGELHLSGQRAHQQHRRRTADLFVNVFPVPSLCALDIENFLGEIRTCHWRLLGIGPLDRWRMRLSSRLSPRLVGGRFVTPSPRPSPQMESGRSLSLWRSAPARAVPPARVGGRSSRLSFLRRNFCSGSRESR